MSSASAQSFPDDGVLGEEGSASKGRSGRRWIIDPIDGTRDFVRGLPFWSVLIGLEDGDEVVAGVCHFPGQKETYSAAKGSGAWRNGTRIGASTIDSVSQALLCVNGLDCLPASRGGTMSSTGSADFWAVRSMGGCGDAALLASGKAEVWLEPTARAWDLAPFKILFEEGGVRFRNFDGGSSIHGGNCIAYAASLEPALQILLDLLSE